MEDHLIISQHQLKTNLMEDELNGRQTQCSKASKPINLDKLILSPSFCPIFSYFAGGSCRVSLLPSVPCRILPK